MTNPQHEPRQNLDRKGPKNSGSGRKVVIVEDNRDTLGVLTYILEHRGYHVVGARDGVIGLQAIRDHRPRLALIDIELPLMDGCEIVRHVRSDSAFDDITLVAMTGYSNTQGHDFVGDFGFDDHLLKPICPSQLLDYISSRLVEE